jgi:hypothetical protein
MANWLVCEPEIDLGFGSLLIGAFKFGYGMFLGLVSSGSTFGLSRTYAFDFEP